MFQIASRLVPLIPRCASALALILLLTLAACGQDAGTDGNVTEGTATQTVAPGGERTTAGPEATEAGSMATATPFPEPTPVVLGDCRDGMKLQPGGGCYYRGGGISRPNVVLSVQHDGAICREGGPVEQQMGDMTLNVANLRLCSSDEFERDDAFQSEIVAGANVDGSWTFYKSRLSARMAAATRTPTPTATPVPPTPAASPRPTPVPPTPTPTPMPTPAPATRLTDNDAIDVSPDWSPDGQRIAFFSDRDGNLDIYVMNADGSGLARLTYDGANDGVPDWSPDGQRIAFASDRDGNYEIYVMNADGSGLARLTDNDAGDGVPAWSADGQRIAFYSDRDGNGEIYVMNADGSGLARLTDNDAGDGPPAWSPDGQRIAFASDRDGNWEIYVMNADGSGLARLTDNYAGDGVPDWSPDGQRIAFASDRDGNWKIYVMNADGSGLARLTDNDAIDVSPDWSPDGQRIAFHSDRDGNTEIYVMNAVGEPLPPDPFLGSCHVGLVVNRGQSCTHKGQSLAVSRDGRVSFGFSSAGGDIIMRNSTINGVTLTLVTSKNPDGSRTIVELE